MLNFTVAPWQLVLRSALIYLGLLLALRLFGKREVGQFTLYDLVLVLLVSNAVQPAMTGPDTSLVGGFLIIATLVVLNRAVAMLDRLGIFHRLLVPAPTVIIQDGRYLPMQLRREGVTVDECDVAIREHGLSDVREVRLGVLEPDGSISIVPREGGQLQRTRRRLHRQRAL
ncbi:MAG TPA: YetF domain-containing protein [Candidatus Dormibacteraeota bacterium]|jgi:uncharacterized membrane protein YcaP (DUF421 family)|nr:YetF domain-containing protein [Candidatus Dormibacteraeota bacterium]